MSSLQVMFFVPLVLFLIIVAPTWIVFHYRSKNRIADGLTGGEREQLAEMIEVANKMAARIETLESILDVDSPEWREKTADEA
jgi:phage shock protein B